METPLSTLFTNKHAFNETLDILTYCGAPSKAILQGFMEVKILVARRQHLKYVTQSLSKTQREINLLSSVRSWI